MAKPANMRIEDVAAATARADLNDILISIASLQTTDGAGTGYTGEPTTTYPNMLWYDKATDILKMRSEADDAWITVGNLNQAANTFAAAVALASQAEAEAGTENTKTMTALRTKQAIDALQYKPFAEAFVTYSGTTPTMVAEYGMATVSRPGAGDTAFTFDTAQPDTNYTIESFMQSVFNTTDARYQYWVLTKSTTGFTVRWRFTTLVASDLNISVVCKRLV